MFVSVLYSFSEVILFNYKVGLHLLNSYCTSMLYAFCHVACTAQLEFFSTTIQSYINSILITSLAQVQNQSIGIRDHALQR